MTSSDRADFEQIAAALALAVEAQVESGRLLGVANLMLRRMVGAHEEVAEAIEPDVRVEPAEKAVSEVLEVPVEAPAKIGSVGLLAADQPAPDGTVRMSVPRFRAITGFLPREFRILASIPDEEFEKAERMGFASYLRGPAEAPVEDHPPAAADLLQAAE
jgi:hypothetical protein